MAASKKQDRVRPPFLWTLEIGQEGSEDRPGRPGEIARSRARGVKNLV